jgi:hypothetical protein
MSEEDRPPFIVAELQRLPAPPGQLGFGQRFQDLINRNHAKDYLLESWRYVVTGDGDNEVIIAVFILQEDE